ncbi:hypothetical protein GX50_05720 [[Emmonsia] crescens]|uniref:FAR-17a/AIG1-like protein n=1 Tax=[Emmonsia] crescens TaxID=73230 RepID=A0A2B7ZEA0_9EURO|nr:hypothetical protein GX50_05720 [Emmonsia crescens]
MRSIHALMGADPAHDNLHHFETSWLFSPLIFSILRLIIFFYCLLTLVIIFAYEGANGRGIHDAQAFSYFTNLSFIGILWYFLVAAIHTFLYSRKGRSVLLNKWPRWLRSMHSLFYTTVVCYPFVVMAVYWALLYRGPWYPVRFNAWTNISQHALPPFFSLFEIIFSMVPPPPLLHIPFLVIILALYLGVAYITHATQGFWVYPFLNPGPSGRYSPRVVGYIFAVVAAQIFVFSVVWFLSFLRVRLVSSKGPKWAKAGDEAWNVRRGVANGDAEEGTETMEIHLDERK